MTAAVIALAICLAGSTTAALLAIRWGMKAKDEAGLAGDHLRAQSKLDEERVAQAVAERDEWKQKAEVATAQMAALKTRLAIVEQERNDADKVARTRIVDAVRKAGAPAAADFVHSVLSQDLRTVRQANPASAGDGDRGAAGVQPAGVAGAAVQPGRIPKP
jgi:hypothetical protein